MDDIDYIVDMKHEVNSLEGVKEVYRTALIEEYRKASEFKEKIMKKSGKDYLDYEEKGIVATSFNFAHYDKCVASSYQGSRGKIIAQKNLFSLKAELYPREVIRGRDERKDSLILKAAHGRFQSDKFPMGLFPKTIDISNLLEREEKEQYSELVEFYNMNNRDVFETYGVRANDQGEHILVANCLLLDSLLKGKYSNLKTINCWQGLGNNIDIKLDDGTEILARDTEETREGTKRAGNITISKDGKSAEVRFDTLITGEPLKGVLTDVNNLDVENVEYTGDPELIMQLQKAMEEQFQSQKLKKETDELTNEELDKRTGAEKIIEFMEENNLGTHDLSLALTMMLGKTSEKENAFKDIIEAAGKDEKEMRIGNINLKDI